MHGHRNVKKLSHFLSKDPHFVSDLRTSLLSGTFLLGACEPIHIFVCKGKTAVVVLKISGANLHSLDAQNLFIRVLTLRRSGFFFSFFFLLLCASR
jgi:hypothetical protein